MADRAETLVIVFGEDHELRIKTDKESACRLEDEMREASERCDRIARLWDCESSSYVLMKDLCVNVKNILYWYWT